MENVNQIKMLIEADKEVQESKYYPLIVEMDRVLQNRFPGGAINRVDIVQKQEISNEEVQGYLAALMAFEEESDDEKKKDISKLADISQPLIFVHCGLMTNYAIGYLQQKYPKLTFECLFFGDSHAAVLMGRSNTKKEFDSKTCGKDLIICDFWAGKSYLATNLPKMQKEGDIPFYTATVNNYTNQVSGLQLKKSHYLSGLPVEVISGDANNRYDKMIRAWVVEDQKRCNQAPFTAPKSPLPLKTTVDSLEIKNALTIVSKCSGWKYAQQKAFAWLECKDQKQAERVLKSLTASKAAVVTLCTKPNETTPFVKCEHIDYNKLTKLAKAATVEQKIDTRAILSAFM
ncbi:MAG: hypothetical protein H0T84_04395 [Tatlockia sp.]|nr:hypothetical protein [Tatlockia sp.]